MRIISGIYKLEDVLTGAVYVGSANKKNGIAKRWSNHSARFKNGTYNYTELQEAYDADPNRIKYEILEECPDDELEEREQYWVNYCQKIDGWTVINKQMTITRKSAVKDTSKMKVAQAGENNGHCTKFKKEDIFKILDMLFIDKLKRKEVAKIFDVRDAYISRIILKQRWKQVTEEWEFCTGISIEA